VNVLGVLLLLAAGHGLVRLVARDADLGVAGTVAFSLLSGGVALAVVTMLAGVTGLPTTLPVLAPPLALLALAPVRPRLPGRADLAPGALAALVGARLAAAAAVLPVNHNDEYAMWAMRGRALARMGRLDPRVFADEMYAHPDYPLLVPSLVSWAHGFGGDRRAAHLHVTLLAVALLLVVAWGVTRLAGRFAAAVAVVAAVVPTGVAVYAVRVMADVANVAYCVALALLLLLWLRDRAPWQWRLAAVMAAGAACTKNEGLAFALATCVVAAAVAPGGLRRKAVPLAVAGFAAATAAPWLVWTRLHGVGNRVVNAGALDRDTDLADRLPVIAEGIAAAWPLPVWWLPLLAVAAAFAVAAGGGRAAAFLGGTAAAAVLVLSAIYVVTPSGDLGAHIAVSAHRVLLFPAVLVAVGIPLLAGWRRAADGAGEVLTPDPGGRTVRATTGEES
jgi:hypothetical protein